ncbi:LytTR family two component transcriptional regulator [Tenacibaculum skagerrakense]|uniref:LytTR family two component transcriptional regulator n=1 Tax=Tenacibaculum skagerrakense TaxID=186571 RepID=A0A4R2P0K2_9FLAO|nr:LytTR family DNA-binding domain-containing protein [Tenacibaculum skagerrakense]TCP28007.1 LytTR family two component transcriptional regulator [Tenacibaculum skagerrakense]
MNCIILEDEIPAQNLLKIFISKVPTLQLVGTFQTANDAKEYLNEHTVDFIFLDINLPDILGIDFIKTVKNPPQVIITTAYPKFAVESFELDTIVDYLVKPFSFDRFLKAIQKVEKAISITQAKSSNNIFLNIDKTLHKVNLDDVLYIESDRNYLTFVTKHKKYVFIDSLKNWSTKLTENFIQVHKSYIINVHQIDKLAGNDIYIGINKIPIGRTFKQEFIKKFNPKNNQ